MGLNAELVGKRYPETRYSVTGEAIRAYSASIDETSPLMGGRHPSVAPPMFAVVYTLANMIQGLFDPDLIQDADLGRMVHGSQRMRFEGLVHPGDQIRTITTVEAVEDKASGQFLKLCHLSRDQTDEPVSEVRSSFFFRGSPVAQRPARPAEPTPVPAGPRIERDVRVALDQAERYAAAAGDRNPIHLDPVVAGRMGFDRPILHGLCTMGLVQRELLIAMADGQPSRLAGLDVRFTQVVHPGDRLSLIAWPISPEPDVTLHAFVVSDQRGQEVIRNGVVSIRQA